jgi:hypothetical protein
VEIFEGIETVCLPSADVQRSTGGQRMIILSRFPSLVVRDCSVLAPRASHAAAVPVKGAHFHCPLSAQARGLPIDQGRLGLDYGEACFSQCILKAKPEYHGLDLSNRG